MPPFDIEQEQSNPLAARILAYGHEKTKKTWWVGKAAEAGFNVILLDSDNGAQILRNIAPEFRNRISHINIVDGLQSPVACQFTTRLLKGINFLWDEQNKQETASSIVKPDRSYYYFDVSKLTLNDVLVIDSWTKLCKSLVFRWYVENGKKIEDTEEAKKSDWPGYRWTGMMASWFFKQLQALSCHVIVVGHQTEYEKYKVEQIGGREVRSLKWSRTQPVSTSGPNGMLIPSEASDILYFYRIMSMFKIDTGGETLRAGGCRSIPPKTFRWEDFQFVDFCKLANYKIPEPNAPLQTACKWFASGDDIPDNLFGNMLSNTGGVIPQAAVGGAAKITLAGLLNKR